MNGFDNLFKEEIAADDEFDTVYNSDGELVDMVGQDSIFKESGEENIPDDIDGEELIPDEVDDVEEAQEPAVATDGDPGDVEEGGCTPKTEEGEPEPAAEPETTEDLDKKIEEIPCSDDDDDESDPVESDPVTPAEEPVDREPENIEDPVGDVTPRDDMDFQDPDPAQEPISEDEISDPETTEDLDKIMRQDTGEVLPDDFPDPEDNPQDNSFETEDELAVGEAQTTSELDNVMNTAGDDTPESLDPESESNEEDDSDIDTIAELEASLLL